MDLSQRALQTKGKFFSNVKCVFDFFFKKPKNIQKNIEA